MASNPVRYPHKGTKIVVNRIELPDLQSSAVIVVSLESTRVEWILQTAARPPESDQQAIRDPVAATTSGDKSARALS